MKKLIYGLSLITIFSLTSCGGGTQEEAFKKYLDNNDLTVEKVDALVPTEDNKLSLSQLAIPNTKVTMDGMDMYLWKDQGKMYVGAQDMVLYADLFTLDLLLSQQEMKVSTTIDSLLSLVNSESTLTFSQIIESLNYEYDDFTFVKGSKNRFELNEQALEQTFSTLAGETVDINSKNEEGFTNDLNVFVEFDGAHISAVDFILKSTEDVEKAPCNQDLSLLLDFTYTEDEISKLDFEMNMKGTTERITNFETDTEDAYNYMDLKAVGSFSKDKVDIEADIKTTVYNIADNSVKEVTSEVSFDVIVENSKVAINYQSKEDNGETLNVFIIDFNFANDWIKDADILIKSNDEILNRIQISTNNVVIPASYLENTEYAIDIFEMLGSFLG